MFTKISVLVPTRHRIARLRTLLSSFEATNDGRAEMVFRLDNDDQETHDLLTRHTNHRLVIGPRYNGYRSMAAFFNEMSQVATGDVLMLGNDDMVFKTPNWPRFVLKAANRYPDSLFNLGVRTFNEDHYPFSIVSRRAASYMGFLWDPRLVWGDLFLRDVMAAFERCVLLPSVEIEHDWIGNQPDQVFLDGDQGNAANWDATYWTKHHACVREAVAKLEVLRMVVQ